MNLEKQIGSEDILKKIEILDIKIQNLELVSDQDLDFLFDECLKLENDLIQLS